MEKLPEDVDVEPPASPEGVLECLLEEPPEAMMDTVPELQPDEESPASQAELGRPPTSVVHGPYYYFYQGGSLPVVQVCSRASTVQQEGPNPLTLTARVLLDQSNL